MIPNAHTLTQLAHHRQADLLNEAQTRRQARAARTSHVRRSWWASLRAALTFRPRPAAF